MSLLVLLAIVSCDPKPPVLPTPPPKPTATTMPPPAPASIRKSPIDQRSYRAVTLKNGLRALVISDADTDMAAAALNVNVGYFDDPPNRPGLAHFLEHMLFMGTKPFPDVDAYNKFISANGGNTNAYTSGEHTAYFFQVQASALEGALDRFAPFFVSPLLDEKFVERERNAVNAEYRMKIKDGGRRQRQVLHAASNPAHPEMKFSVGNLETLADKDGKPVYEDLRAFYKKHYGPSRMTLSVIGRQDLDTLQSWLEERFGGVSGEPVERPERPAPFTADQLGVRIDIQALRDTRSVSLQWALPPARAVWPKRPHAYISNVLGHEGEGSLFAYLKSKGWIEALYSGSGGSAKDYDLFSLTIPLTELGYQHIDDVVAATFQYLRMLGQGTPPKYLHDEMRRMAEIGFQFKEESQPMSVVQNATSAMHDYPIQNVNDWWATWGDFDAALIRDLLTRMTVDKVRVVVTSKAAKTDRVEPLYSVPWAMRKLTASEKTKWNTGKADAAMAIPIKNPWLPENIALRDGATDKEPKLVTETTNLKVWHLQETQFGAPRGYVVVRLRTAAPNNLKSNVLGELHARMLQDALELWKYPANLAGLSMGWNAATSELELTLTGYDDKQPAILAELLERLSNLEIDNSRFAFERAELARDWKNRKLSRPYQQTGAAMRVVLDPEGWSRPDAVATLEKLQPDDLRAWWKAASQKLWAQVFVHGNHSREAAVTMGERVRKKLLVGSAGAAGVNTTRLLPLGELVLDLPVDHDDSSLVVTYQGGKTDLATEARYELLGAALKTPFFTELRTKQQLGYIVSAYACNHDVLPAMCFIIQSTTTGADELLAKVDAFLVSQRERLEKSPESEIVALRNGVVARLREAHTQLYQRSQDLHGNLRMRLAWNHDHLLAAEVEKLTKASLLEIYDATLTKEKARRLVVRSFGRSHKPKAPSKSATWCQSIACAIGKLPKTHSRAR